MTKQDAIDYYGGPLQLARALEIWPQAVYQWGRYPPMAKQYELQVKTDGKLKAEPKKVAKNG